MITISHDRARLTVNPEKAEGARTLLALIDKTDGQKGLKYKKDSEIKRCYPRFHPGMSTVHYLQLFPDFNGFLNLKPVEFTVIDRAAPMLNSAQPECLEEPDPDYVFVAPVAKAKAKRSDALRDALLACLPDLKHYAATHGEGPDKRLAALLEALK